MMVGMMAPPLSTRMTQGAVTRVTMAAVMRVTRRYEGDQEGRYEWDQDGGYEWDQDAGYQGDADYEILNSRRLPPPTPTEKWPPGLIKTPEVAIGVGWDLTFPFFG